MRRPRPAQEDLKHRRPLGRPDLLITKKAKAEKQPGVRKASPWISRNNRNGPPILSETGNGEQKHRAQNRKRTHRNLP
jgi:hypothetical protein